MMNKPALYTGIGIGVIVGAFAAWPLASSANDALAFVNSNWSNRIAAPLDIRTDHMKRDGERARIKAATEAAARRHGVPVEFLHRLTMRESGYRFVQGPPTQWGRAQGPHQILCGTARELGERDCGLLMRDADRSADLAARYVMQGYRATGSWGGAAAFYHGGPNRRLWGHKTRAYAQAVGGSFPRTVSATAPPRGKFGDVPIVVAGFVPSSFGVR